MFCVPGSVHIPSYPWSRCQWPSFVSLVNFGKLGIYNKHFLKLSPKYVFVAQWYNNFPNSYGVLNQNWNPDMLSHQILHFASLFLFSSYTTNSHARQRISKAKYHESGMPLSSSMLLAHCMHARQFWRK